MPATATPTAATIRRLATGCTRPPVAFDVVHLATGARHRHASVLDNALAAAARNRALAIVVGTAAPTATADPVDHAWCVDAVGCALEVAWDHVGHCYRGSVLGQPSRQARRAILRAAR